MARLTEDMVIARTKSSDMATIKKLNCWGSDLEDISLVRRFTHVEVLSLSLNRIRTLADFQFCHNLVELYVRRNSISCLTEVCYLRELPRLRRLLLAENPCVDSAGGLYRPTVLRCLPHLEVLDNQQVSPEEVEVAMRTGLILELERRDHSQNYYEESYDFEEEPAQYFQQNGETAKDISVQESANGGSKTNQEQQQQPQQHSPPQQHQQQQHSPPPQQHQQQQHSPPQQQHQLQHSPPHPQQQQHSPPHPHHQRRLSSPEGRSRNGRRNSDYHEERRRAGVKQSSPPRGKSNILSAMLCLLPELDLPSLEVLELTVRRRMDEFGG